MIAIPGSVEKPYSKVATSVSIRCVGQRCQRCAASAAGVTLAPGTATRKKEAVMACLLTEGVQAEDA